MNKFLRELSYITVVAVELVILQFWQWMQVFLKHRFQGRVEWGVGGETPRAAIMPYQRTH